VAKKKTSSGPIDLSLEKLSSGPKATIWRDATNSIIAKCSGTEFSDATEQITTERLIACWNACRGISTVQLKTGALKKVVNAARAQLLDLQDTGEDRNDETGEEYSATKSLRRILAPFKAWF
jgi:hypothetical protein